MEFSIPLRTTPPPGRERINVFCIFYSFLYLLALLNCKHILYNVVNRQLLSIIKQDARLTNKPQIYPFNVSADCSFVQYKHIHEEDKLKVNCVLEATDVKFKQVME